MILNFNSIIKERARERRQKEQTLARKKRHTEKKEAPTLMIPSKTHPDYKEIGWRWADVFKESDSKSVSFFDNQVKGRH